MLKRTFLASMIAASFATVSLPSAASPHIWVNIGPPPPPRVEYIPAPRWGYDWAPGFWELRGHRHVWVAGHWVRHRPGYYYHSPQWVERDGRWYFEREQWARADRDHDGIPNRYDRDRDNDGVQNRYDRAPDNRRRY